MIGYHYTSATNWKAIQSEGLKPYRTSIADLASAFGKPATGVWLYTQKPRGLSHLGCIMWQVVTKETSDVVLLSVKYQKKWLLPFPVTHDLNWKGFFFHKNTDAHIVLRAVPPENIRLVQQYDVSEFADLYDYVRQR